MIIFFTGGKHAFPMQTILRTSALCKVGGITLGHIIYSTGAELMEGHFGC